MPQKGVSQKKKSPPKFGPDSAQLMGPAFWFGNARSIDPHSDGARALLESLTLDEDERSETDPEKGPSFHARKTAASHFSPLASPKKVPEEEHRTLSIDEIESLSPSPVRDGIARSTLLHSAILMLVLLKTLVLPGDPVTVSPTLRVDLVGLPDFLKKDLQAVNNPPPDLVDALKQADQAAQKLAEEKREQAKEEEQEAARVKEKKEPEVAEEGDETYALKKLKDSGKRKKDEKRERDEAELERKDKLKKALARVKALSRLESIKDAEKQQRVKTDGLENRSGTLMKGNRLSRGTSLDGEAREAAETSYYERVRDKLVNHWALPVWLSRQNYQAQVVIYLDSSGRLRDFKFTKPSGSETFDAAVKRTLQESQPFAAPPDELASDVQNRGILVGFPL